MFVVIHFPIMWPQLTLLALTLAVVQASTPAPRKAAYISRHASANRQQQGESKDKPLSSNSLISEGTGPKSQQRDGADEGATHQDEAITIRKLPTVSISKDWADWGVWWFSLFLAVVGFLQALFLYKTLLAIKVQASQMGTQTAILEKSVVVSEQASLAANRSVQAYINKEKPRIRVRPGLVHFGGTLEPAFIECTIEQFGPTAAWIEESSWGASLADSMEAEVKCTIPMGLQGRTCSGVLKHYTFHIFKKGALWFEPDEVSAINEKRILLLIAGAIAFRDDFEEGVREVRFRYVYRAYTGYDGEPAYYWERCGPPEANLET